MRRGLAIGTVAFALALGAALAPTRSQTQEPALEDWAGTFVLRGDRRELGSMDDAINRVVDQMNLFVREIARGEIHRRINPEQRIRFAVLGERTLSLRFDDHRPAEVPVGAPPVRWRNEAGEDVRLTLRFGGGGRLIHHSATPRGGRTNVFVLDEGGERLTMHVRISSDQLPADIRDRLTSRRAD